MGIDFPCPTMMERPEVATIMVDGKLIPIPNQNHFFIIQIEGLDWVWVLVVLS